MAYIESLHHFFSRLILSQQFQNSVSVELSFISHALIVRVNIGGDYSQTH